ncbi:hypothetical protein [Micrococcus luteus]|uniref:hypothetical protein n=1 Tax=Micrococcus luteus TaxID=1270 RepID=UPI00331D0054
MSVADLDLAEVARRLEAAYEVAREHLMAEIRQLDLPHTPEEVRDSAGRYLLLDTLAALVQARAALASPGAPAEALVVRPGDTLIVRLASDVRPAEYERFRDTAMVGMRKRMPGVEVIVVSGVEQMAVYRPDRPTEGDSA